MIDDALYLIETMQQAEMFKRNANIEDLFMLVSKCIRHCHTINKSNLSLEETKCLENCGYNRSFLNAHMKDLVENATWTGEQTSSFPNFQ